MSAVRAPLREHAPCLADGPTSQRLWRGVVTRRERTQARATQRRVVLWFALGALIATLLPIGFDAVRGRNLRDERGGRGPLALADGGVLGPFEARPAAPVVRADLADGSRVLLEADTRLEPLENTAHVLALLLVRGRASFDVHPGGPRRWSIECGLATVEVVGTGFTLTRTPGRLVVEVDHGTVLVRGERIRDRVQRLTAGARLEVTDAAPALPTAPPAGVVTAAPVPEPPAGAHGWRDLATRGAYSDAYRMLGASGMGSAVARSASAQDLMALADIARLSGHPADAIAPLTRMISEHPDDSRAPLAAFTLGKIHLGSPGQAEAAEAVGDFERAMLLGLPSGLLEDAYVYLVEAKAKAGDSRGARAAAETYAKRFPDSTRARELVNGAVHR